VVGATPAQQLVCQESVRAVHAHTARLQRLAQARQDHVTTWRLQPVVEALQAWRGVPCIVAVTLVAAWGELTRVHHPRQLMSELGLTPSAYSRGARRRQGPITQAGHTQARRALVEGAWA
jgi:transposase